MPKGEDFVGPFLFPGMVEEFVTEGAEGLWIATGGQEPVGAQAAIDPAGHSQHQRVGVDEGLNPNPGGVTLLWDRMPELRWSRLLSTWELGVVELGALPPLGVGVV